MPLSERQWKEFKESLFWKELIEHWNEELVNLYINLANKNNEPDMDVFIKGRIHQLKEFIDDRGDFQIEALRYEESEIDDE